MAMSTMATAQQALKLFYLPGLQYQLNNSTPILSVLEKDSTSVAGDQIVMALRYGRQGGIGNRLDDGLLPTPNARKTKQASWQTKNIFARIQITDKTMRASRSQQGAFVSLLEADLEDAMTDAKDNLSRQVFGDGSGKLATCAAGTNVATITVDKTDYFSDGMLIDICTSAGVPLSNGVEREIVSVDDVAKTITVAGTANITPTATSIVTVSGSYGLELTGLGSVFTPDNTLYNVNRATAKWFNPTVLPVNGELSETKIQQGTDDTERKAGGNVNFYATSHGVRRAYQSLLLGQKRFVEPMKLEGGWQVLSYNGKPFTTDKYAPVGTLYGLDTSTWKNYQMMDWDWLDEDGAVLSRVSGKAAWEATLAKYSDLGCSKPRGNVIFTGIVEH
jgi:hypothetical protein